jgi:hypothetical protein
VLVKRCKISGSHSQCEKDSTLAGCYVVVYYEDGGSTILWNTGNYLPNDSTLIPQDFESLAVGIITYTGLHSCIPYLIQQK